MNGLPSAQGGTLISPWIVVARAVTSNGAWIVIACGHIHWCIFAAAHGGLSEYYRHRPRKLIDALTL